MKFLVLILAVAGFWIPIPSKAYSLYSQGITYPNHVSITIHVADSDRAVHPGSGCTNAEGWFIRVQDSSDGVPRNDSSVFAYDTTQTFNFDQIDGTSNQLLIRCPDNAGNVLSSTLGDIPEFSAITTPISNPSTLDPGLVNATGQIGTVVKENIFATVFSVIGISFLVALLVAFGTVAFVKRQWKDWSKL